MSDKNKNDEVATESLESVNDKNDAQWELERDDTQNDSACSGCCSDSSNAPSWFVPLSLAIIGAATLAVVGTMAYTVSVQRHVIHEMNMSSQSTFEINQRRNNQIHALQDQNLHLKKQVMMMNEQSKFKTARLNELKGLAMDVANELNDVATYISDAVGEELMNTGASSAPCLMIEPDASVAPEPLDTPTTD